MKADIAGAVLMLHAFFVRGSDPEPRLAVGPADRVLIFIRNLEAEEFEQTAIEGFGFLIIADPDDKVINSDDTHHRDLLNAPLPVPARRAGYCGCDRCGPGRRSPPCRCPAGRRARSI